METGYHPGEKHLQGRMGELAVAAKVGQMITPVIPPAAIQFLREQFFVVTATLQEDQIPWPDLLLGHPGFLQATGPSTLHISGIGQDRGFQLGQEIGTLTLQPHTRRRMRLNGTVTSLEAGLTIEAHQVYSNCPKYIQARTFEPRTRPEPQTLHLTALDPTTLRIIEQADTFFVASGARGYGADASHRGGHPGVIKVQDAQTLSFPDFSGNRMYNTLGNLHLNPKVGLLFVDFADGHVLRLLGKAEVLIGEDLSRTVEVHLEAADLTQHAFPYHQRFLGYSPHIPRSEGEHP
ncbi:pyridoxamine 5'-phosphate oxidase family protein [Deinococcus cellulosilyticus]|uniref:Uncharacterized protein n=1 Tax=Deinococcus cellulosilyticus (strain DSM 18568 / NBRC 106333 / KACC 11606 / 5516J-15) TaxID=1223518 RepID=A0A511NAD1_DEIC1|nr:pyridoxamine 5'-phosphate oxidase family protein [Deinococcus cellulosilyticus]GEM49321.1 hypothetical protein DC3_49560 [Deinococcus cellulosilyticus NBRC 106333 = KACC 11606]